MSRIGTYSCPCCGEQESTGNCVRGLRCGCENRQECKLCCHCVEHHHRNCTEELRQKRDDIEIQAMVAVGKLRDENRINIFERGVVKNNSFGLRNRRLNL